MFKQKSCPPPLLNKNNTIIIKHSDITALNISADNCIKWVKEAFSIKPQIILPVKTAIKPPNTNNFFTTMPVLLPEKYNVFGVKVVTRIIGREPALQSEILLYDSQSGNLLVILDANWITTMRTAAVAALSIELLQQKNNYKFSFIGLGNTARATAICLCALYKNIHLNFQLLQYKNQADLFIEKFKNININNNQISFEIIPNVKDLISKSNVIISAITETSNLICEDSNLYKKGVLIIPIHMKGFQNCDIVFDKVFGDDFDHIKQFQYFQQMKSFTEISQVLNNKNLGRTNDNERIICYNYGIALHDILFAYKIYNLIIKSNNNFLNLNLNKETNKFWI